MELVTPRLLLREFHEDDWVATQRYESDPIVTRYQTNGCLSAEESRQYLRRSMASSRERPRRTFDLAVVLRAGSTLVGRVGVHLTQPELREAMLWYVLAKEYWGQGLVPEAAKALMHFAFTELKVHRLFGDCDPRNQASARVMEKLGMRKEAHFVRNAFIKGEWCDSIIYALLGEEWRRMQGDGHVLRGS